MLLERKEYPRPQFRRQEWESLNGEWEFAFDDDSSGEMKGYFTGNVKLNKKINVPFAYQCEASGIADCAVHETVWYRRTFFLNEDRANKHALLCFNGVDYEADVWVNGIHVVSHTGAYAPFFADVTKYLKTGENVLVVRAYDPNREDIPRGKQSWTGERFACWYHATTGIWQSVWLEFFRDDCICGYSLLSDYDHTAFYGEINTLYGIADQLKITATFEGKIIQTQTVSLEGNYAKYRVVLQKRFRDDFSWHPECPRLIYVTFTLLKGGVVLDEAQTRFGMRKISVNEHGRICLNGKPIYQRLVLDQGYWQESGITPPSAEALKRDIELAKAMGFNGARKHQKAEDPYYCYYAEELGFLTWCEMPSAYCFNARETAAISREWYEILQNAKNATSNICYVPLNESWGVREIYHGIAEKNFAKSLYYLTKAQVGDALISTNDGFEVVNPTDILGIHDYDRVAEEQFAQYYASERYDEYFPQGWSLYAEGESHEKNRPVLFTEFGGRALKSDEDGGAWGYSGAAENVEAFLKQLRSIVKGIYSCNAQGFCYTQLTDVQQEVNGLLYANRTPKADMKELKSIFENKN